MSEKRRNRELLPPKKRKLHDAKGNITDSASETEVELSGVPSTRKTNNNNEEFEGLENATVVKETSSSANSSSEDSSSSDGTTDSKESNEKKSEDSDRSSEENKEGSELSPQTAQEDTSGSADLPSGWKKVWHNSGLPVYVHDASRVCTLLKPYSLGMRGVKDHTIPSSSFPCLECKTALKDDKQSIESGEEESDDEVTSTDPVKTNDEPKSSSKDGDSESGSGSASSSGSDRSSGDPDFLNDQRFQPIRRRYGIDVVMVKSNRGQKSEHVNPDQKRNNKYKSWAEGRKLYREKMKQRQHRQLDKD